jgi:hypothetical protein
MLTLSPSLFTHSPFIPLAQTSSRFIVCLIICSLCAHLYLHTHHSYLLLKHSYTSLFTRLYAHPAPISIPYTHHASVSSTHSNITSSYSHNSRALYRPFSLLETRRINLARSPARCLAHSLARSQVRSHPPYLRRCQARNLRASPFHCRRDSRQGLRHFNLLCNPQRCLPRSLAYSLPYNRARVLPRHHRTSLQLSLSRVPRLSRACSRPFSRVHSRARDQAHNRALSRACNQVHSRHLLRHFSPPLSP